MKSDQQIQLETLESKQTRYKSFFSFVLIVANLSLSSFYFGYSLAYFSTIEFQYLKQIFQITLEQSTAKGLLTACIPIGAGIGALSSFLLLKYLSRRNCILSINLLAVIIGGIIFIENFIVLLFARLIQGICVGFYSAIIPLCIKQIAPNEISGTLGAMNQLFLTFGVTFAYLFEWILQLAQVEVYQRWHIVFGLTLLTISFQTCNLLFIYPYETPKYLLLSNRRIQAEQFIKKFYKTQYVDQILKEKQSDLMEDDQVIKQSILSAKQSLVTQKSGNDSPKKAIFTAFFIALTQQMVGINAVVAYGSDIAHQAQPLLQKAFPVIINFETMVAAFITSYLLSIAGRRVILLGGLLISFVTLTLISIGYFIKQQSNVLGIVFILIGLIIYMAAFGLSLGPVVWLYVAEIVQPKYLPYSTLFNWIGASLVILLFPIIKSHLPKENPAFLFVFFAAWSAVSLFIAKYFIIETKGKTQKEIANGFST